MKILKPLMLVVAGMAIVLVTSCSNGSNTESTDKSERLIFKKENYGDKWPFSVNEIEVYCSGAHEVYFRANGRAYALNGVAKSQSKSIEGMGKVEDIWLDDPNLEGLKIGLPDEFIREGLKLCEK